MVESPKPPQTIDLVALASLVRRFLPNPLSDQPDPFLANLSDEEALALDKILKDLGATKEKLNTSPLLRTQVLAAISALLSSTVLGDDRGEAAAKRLGSRGDLQLDLYKIRFGDIVKEFEKLGVKRTHIEEIIRAPDSIQHLSPPSGATSDFPGISLIAKRITPKKNPSFIALVQASRQENELRIQSVWRLPEHIAARADEISTNRTTTPSELPTLLDILKMFVQQFGLYFNLPNRQPTQFVLYDVVKIEGDKPQELLKIANPENASFQMNLMVKVSPLNVAAVANAYVINTDAYKREVKLEG